MNDNASTTTDSEGIGALFMTDPALDHAYILTWDRAKISVTARLDTRVNLPILYGKASYCAFRAFACDFSSFPAVVDDDDDKDRPETMDIATGSPSETS